MSEQVVSLVLKENNDTRAANSPCGLCSEPIADLGQLDLGVFVEGTDATVCTNCMRKFVARFEPVVRHGASKLERNW